MTLLEKCQNWNGDREYQKIIDAIEALPQDERTPELDSELARAYNNRAEAGDRELYKKAIALLEPHAEYFSGDHCWNYRMAYAYYYLDREDLALEYFEAALKARPGDEDTQEFIEQCRSALALPLFPKNFRERTAEAWQIFASREAELRGLFCGYDGDAKSGISPEDSEKLLRECGDILELVFTDPTFGLGVGTKCELTLSADGDRAKLYELQYFKEHAPDEVLRHWDIIVARPRNSDFELRIDDLWIGVDDVQALAEPNGDNSVELTMYCEKLLPLLSENEDRVWWTLGSLCDFAIGEVNSIAIVDGLEISDKPLDGAVSLSALPEKLKELGIKLYSDAGEYLDNSYLSYQLEPNPDRDADWRMDTVAGTTRLPALINDYLHEDSTTFNSFFADHIAAGFIIFPLDGFNDNEDSERGAETRSARIYAFRDRLESALTEKCGDAITIIGDATGLYCGYVDFIAWDLRAVLGAASEFFDDSDIAWASFHSFRRDTNTIALKTDDEPPEIHEDTGSILSSDDIAELEDMTDNHSGYYHRMVNYIDEFVAKGVEEKRFTQRQARRDLQVALWYAYGCLNCDEYEYYYRAAQWMPASEQNAKGCGTWYYRYSCALTYCSRLEEALRYAEQGALEEPDYPWIYLQLGKLRAYFGDKAGALKAVDTGLKLVPRDHEFTTLKAEIKAGATLEQMEYHWINADDDQDLQNGLSEDGDAKQQAISCIVTDPDGVEYFRSLFGDDLSEYLKDSPYCSFRYPVGDYMISVIFSMNEAGLSKLPREWMSARKAQLDDCSLLEYTASDGNVGRLDMVIFGLDLKTELRYKTLGATPRDFRLFLDKDGNRLGDEEYREEDEGGENESSDVVYYTEDEMKAVEEHIERCFGKFGNVWHEIKSQDIHVDVCVIPPDDGRDYCTLVTMGMGARRMNVPENLAEHNLDRAELAIALPSDWKLDQDSIKDENWYWPIRLLKTLAHLPIDCDTWLGWGHTVDNQEPFAETTKLSAVLLVSAQSKCEDAGVCTLPDGSEVNFYNLIPIYPDEMEYKKSHNADKLLERMENVSFIVDPGRADAMDGYDPDNDEDDEDDTFDTDVNSDSDSDYIMDMGEWHLDTLHEKELPVDDITVYNHMAIYLRWAIENHLMSHEFLQEHMNIANAVLSAPESVDLREFIRDELGGMLTTSLFDDEGDALARYYYGDNAYPHYPSDIDDYALKYFGPKRYHSREFKDEAYLYIPFDEDYYRNMASVIDRRRRNFESQSYGDDLKPSQLAKDIMRYLGCECEYFPPMADDDPISSAYSYSRRLGVREGYIPVLVAVDDTLFECLVMNSDPDCEDDYRKSAVERYRNEQLANTIGDGRAILAKYVDTRREEAADDDLDWDELVGEVAGGEAFDRMASYWNYETSMTVPLILAKVPVKNPWEIFAYLPFGGWNECPDTPELMAIAKYWYEEYGAVPAALTHDVLEFILPEPVKSDKALPLAVEQYGFCPDIVDQGGEDMTIGKLADILTKSIIWYFWWD